MLSALPAEMAALVEGVEPRHPHPINRSTVSYECQGVPMEGLLFEPQGGSESKRAVLILHAWSGVGAYVDARARMVSRLGWTAFAADLYGTGVRPATTPEMSAEAGKYYADLGLLRDRVRAGFDVLTARGIAPEDIVVVGYCFGGTAALEFARTAVPCAGIVSVHGQLVLHEPSDVDRIVAPILIQTGGDDDLVTDADLAAYMDELRGAQDLDWRVTVHSGAPHAYTVPGPRYRPLADARSWREVVDFLDEVLPAASSNQS